MNASWDDGRIYIHHTVSRTPTGEYDLHCHHSYEVYCFLEGDAEYLVEGRVYRPAPGSVLLLPPNVFHGVKVLSDRRYDRMALHFLGELIRPECESLLSCFRGEGAYYAQAQSYRLDEYFYSLLECAEMPEDLRAVAQIARLEALLSQVALLCARVEPMRPPQTDPDGLAARLIEYVNAHYTGEMSLDELSGRFFLSKNQLNRVFRRATGATVMAYAARKRIALARRLISEGESAQRAALRAGYGDYSNFYRQYKKLLGVAPHLPGNVAK